MAVSPNPRTIQWARLLVLAGLLVLADGSARAESMDPVLGRLRLAAGEGECAGDRAYCPDQAGFEALAQDLGAVFLSPVPAPAHTEGPAGTSVFLSTTGTVVDRDGRHFREASEAALREQTPDRGLLVHRLQVRRGLPLGFELGGAFGLASNTSMWTLGFQLKLAILEGFRTGIGVLPDLAVGVSWDAVVGASALSLHVLSADVVASKPLIIGANMRIVPLIGAQLFEVRARTGLVDLTPEVDGFSACAPMAEPFGEPPQCTADGTDLAHVVAFSPVSQVRLRFVAGVMAELGAVRLAAACMAGLPRLGTNLAATASAGIAF